MLSRNVVLCMLYCYTLVDETATPDVASICPYAETKIYRNY